MSTGKLISADSHVVEPPDLWATRIDPKFREDAPRLITEDGIHRWYVAQGVSIGSVGAASDAGKRYDEPEALSIEAKFEEAPTGAYDPHARLKDQGIDGVVGEIVYPTIATRLYTLDIDSQLLSANAARCEACGAEGAERHLSTFAFHEAQGTKLAELDPKNDELVDEAWKSSPP